MGSGTEETPNVMWYAGIDWAERHHDVVLIDAQGARLAQLRVAHSPDGLRTLVAWLRGQGDVAEHPEHLACLVETTRGLLITALLEAGLAIYSVDPGRLKALRKPAGAKTDARDAYALARLGRSELRELRRLVPDSDLVRELKVLTRDQDGLIHQQTRLVNQLTACLKEAYPAALGLFSQLHQRSTLAFLAAFPTHQQAAQADVSAIAAVLLRTKHPTARATAARIATQLQAPQLHVDAATARAKARLTQALVAQLQLLLEQVAAYDAAVTALLEAHADRDLFASLPGAGKRLAPHLLAEWATTGNVTLGLPASRRWPGPVRCSTKAASIPAHVTDEPAASRWARHCTTSRGRAYTLTRRHGRTTCASARRARHISQQCGRWPIAGCASCTPCRSSIRATTPPSSALPNRRTALRWRWRDPCGPDATPYQMSVAS